MEGAHVESTISELTALLKTFKSMRSHCSSSSCVVYQNTCNGPITASRHSAVLVKEYTTENPLVRLLLTAVQRQLLNHKDGGCMLGMLICHLVLSFCKTDYHPRMYSNILTWCSHQCVDILPKISGGRTFVISTQSIVSMIQGLLSSKLSTYISSSALETVVKQVAEVYIMTGGDIGDATVEYILGMDVKHRTVLHSGVLLDRHHSPVILPAGLYTAVFVSCSLSGDSEQLHNATYIGPSSLHLSNAIISRMEHLIGQFAAAKVSLLICQKVIHPKVKLLLQRLGIKYLERLGLKINKLLNMTGVKSYQSITERSVVINSVDIIVRHIQHNNDTHLLINTRDNHKPTFTMLLYSWTEQISSDIKRSCIQALDVLQGLLRDTRLLPGNGKWQRQLVEQIMDAMNQVPLEEVRKMGSNLSSFRLIVGDFTSSLKISNGSSAQNSLTSVELSADMIDCLSDCLSDCLLTQQSLLTTAVSISNAIILTNQVLTLS